MSFAGISAAASESAQCGTYRLTEICREELSVGVVGSGIGLAALFGHGRRTPRRVVR